MNLELLLFWTPATVAVVSTALVITRKNASRALVYLVISLLAVAVVFFVLGAPFAAALEVVVYAGAIVVLFLFVVMMLNLGRSSALREGRWLRADMWVLPSVLAFVLLIVLFHAFAGGQARTSGVEVPPRAVGRSLFGPYLLAVELAGFLLLAALVGAYHLGRRYLEERRADIGADRDGAGGGAAPGA